MNRLFSCSGIFALILVMCFSVLANATDSTRRLNNQRTALIKEVWKNLETTVVRSDLEKLYVEDVIYQDPLLTIPAERGLETLFQYWTVLHSKYKKIAFIYKDSVIQGDSHMVRWEMWAQDLNSASDQPSSCPVEKNDPCYVKCEVKDGMTLRTTGVSDIIFKKRSVKIVSQRDIMDMGEASYVNIPGVGDVIRKIKANINLALGLPFCNL